MIFDSHCHAWRRWPYRPPVPDPDSRARVEQLLWEMDASGVDRALLVAANIDENPEDNAYVAECVRRHPDRLSMVADVDCCWSPTHQTPGAADRLSRAADEHPLVGFTHYVRRDDPGDWYLSADGLAFFAVAERRGLLASLAVPPAFQPTLRALAERFPGVTFLLHHMAGVRADEPEPRPLLASVLASARLPNVHVKLSGFHYVSPNRGEYPYPDCRPIVRALYERFGPRRLHWGSDYPVVRPFMTYRQTIEAVRTHCAFIPPADLDLILGEGLRALIEENPRCH